MPPSTPIALCSSRAVGPTALLLHKAIGVEGGVLFPAYQRIDTSHSAERFRIAINLAYFFWLK